MAEAAQEEAAQPDDAGAEDRRGGGVGEHPRHCCRGADRWRGGHRCRHLC